MPYPVEYRFRDINADCYICLHHARLMDEEAGQFDNPLRESFEEHTRQKFSSVPTVDGENGIHWNGFHLVKRPSMAWSWPRNIRAGTKQIESYLDKQRKIRVREQANEEILIRRAVREVKREERRQQGEIRLALRYQRGVRLAELRRQKEERREYRAIRDASLALINKEFNARVQVVRIERENTQREVQKRRMKIVSLGGIWTPTRQMERYDTIRDRIWRQVEMEFMSKITTGISP